MIGFNSDWKGTVLALLLVSAYWAWDNKWAILFGGGVTAGVWLSQ